MIDDLQWAEPMMLDLVEYLAEWVADSPLLLACMARPELLDVRPAWGGGKLNATAINLEPLSTSECGTLVANLLAIDTLDQAVRERIAAVAEGHPLFAEEMLAMLVDDGRLVREGSSWVAAGALEGLAVPPTTSALLAARIDRLLPGERATLERASVMGQVFYRGALDELADGDASVDLATLVRKQFVRTERSDVPGMDAMAFRHLMIRDAAYEGMPKTLRADLHERFAEWLEANAPEQPELIGYHLEQAHRYVVELAGPAERVETLAQRSGAHLRVAGRRAFERNDAPATAGLLSRATTLLSSHDPLKPPSLIELGIALTELGELDRGLVTLDQAISLSEVANDELLAARAHIIRTYVSFWGTGPGVSWEEAREQVLSALSLFERAGDDLGGAWAWCLLGSITWAQARAAETREAWRRSIDLFRLAGESRMAGEYLTWLASVSTWGPTPCIEALHELESLRAEAAGSIAVEAEIASESATVLWMTGEFDEARRVAHEGHLQRLQLGRRVMDVHASQTLGWVELMAGNAPEAERILGAAARELREIGSLAAAQLLSGMHAHALYALGRYDDADRAALQSSDGYGHDAAAQTLLLSARAMVAARRGALDEGEKLAREAISLIGNGDFINDQADALMALAEVLQIAGRRPEAAAAVREALDRYRRKGNTTQTARAESRLAELEA